MMKKFKNEITREILNLYDFVILILDEAERQWEDNNDEPWCNLTKEEQIELACEQYEHQIENDWKEIY